MGVSFFGLNAGTKRLAKQGLGYAASALLVALLAGPAAADDQVDLDPNATDPVARGKYLATAADCAPCHTGPNMKPFSGGLIMDTPFGSLSTPNLTPDKETGLGEWNFAQFYQAIHRGIRRDGEYLYPVFPYPSFTKITEKDAKDIFAYLQSLEPVHAPRKESGMSFPFNIRASLVFWRQLYFDEGTFQPDPKVSDEINRGSYLVNALGHCGACHSPRTLLGGTEDDRAFQGGEVDTYFAPDITGSLADGIGGWTDEQLTDYLTKGAAKGKGTVFGPMAEVVNHSLSKLPASDIKAIVAYLKHTASLPKEDADNDPDLRKHAGAIVYLNNCAACHQPEGTGINGAVPNLKGNDAVMAGEPKNILSAVLGGLPGQGNYGQMPSFAPKLTDREVADVANYIRNAWGNSAPPSATPDMVASLRTALNVPEPAGLRPNPDFVCPSPTGGSSGDGVTVPKPIMALMAHATPEEVGNRVHVIISQLHREKPNLSDAELTNMLVTAYCPILADAQDLSDEEKHQYLATFSSKIYQVLSKERLPPGSRILVQVPLAPDVLGKVEADAKAKKEDRAKWIEDAIEKALSGAN